MASSRFRFSLSQVLTATGIIAICTAWFADRQSLKTELAKSGKEVQRLRTEYDWGDDPSMWKNLAYTNFDKESKRLYAALIDQDEFWKSGLIYYLGMDRFKGRVDPTVNRTVWWSAKIQDQDGALYHVFLADRAHHWYVRDASAYIVTDANLNLVAWHGTRIHGEKVYRISLLGKTFPATLNFGEGSYHNGDSSECTAQLTKEKLVSPRG